MGHNLALIYLIKYKCKNLLFSIRSLQVNNVRIHKILNETHGSRGNIYYWILVGNWKLKICKSQIINTDRSFILVYHASCRALQYICI